MTRSKPHALPLFALLSAACDRGASKLPSAASDGGASLTTTVTPEGATLELPGGAELIIPEGALDEEVEITATVVTDLEAAGVIAMTEGFAAPSFAISLEPHGLRFNRPATLTLPGADGMQWPAVMHADFDQAESWEPLGPLSALGGTVSLEIDGFSTYALTLVRDGACPCFDAADTQHYYAEAADLGWLLLYNFGSTTWAAHGGQQGSTNYNVWLAAYGASSSNNCKARAGATSGIDRDAPAIWLSSCRNRASRPRAASP